MPIHADVTPATATGDTVETSIGTITLPTTSTILRGVSCMAAGGAGLTTLETISGIFRIDSPSIPNLSPNRFLLDVVIALTSGAVAFSPRIYAMDYRTNGAAVIEFFVTMDLALAINPTARGMVLFETS